MQHIIVYAIDKNLLWMQYFKFIVHAIDLNSLFCEL